jgi:DNA invertase Pin-like site-specific DNA recombinase
MYTESMSSTEAVVGYIRVSTAEQADSGLGLAAQRKTIEDEIERRGWTLIDWFEDAGASGKSMTGRPGLTAALKALDSGEVGTLVVAKLDRLSRSVHDAAGVLDRAQKKGWSLVACDLGVDTTTPAGEAMANVMATFAQLERRMIGQRTRDALAVKKAQGVRLGRPKAIPGDVVRRIVTERDAGNTWTEIGLGLDHDEVPTAHGGERWWPATVRSMYESEVDAESRRPRSRNGPRPILADDVRQRIAREREAGRSLRQIADSLNDEGVQTAKGGRWHASTVSHVVRSVGLDRQLEGAGGLL